MEIEWQKVKVEDGKVPNVEISSGIELLGRNDEEPAPETWYIADAETNQHVAKVHQRWGFTPLPAGEYIVGLLPQGYKAVEIEWQKVKTSEGKVSTVEVNSGIEMVEPEGAKEAPEWIITPT